MLSQSHRYCVCLSVSHGAVLSLFIDALFVLFGIQFYHWLVLTLGEISVLGHLNGTAPQIAKD